MPATQCPETQSSLTLQLEPLARRSSHAPLGPQNESPGQPTSAHDDAHSVGEPHTPVAQRMAAPTTHSPEAEHTPAGINRPAVHEASEQRSPTSRGDQSAALRVGSHTRHGYAAWRVPRATQTPPIAQPSPAGDQPRGLRVGSQTRQGTPEGPVPRATQERPTMHWSVGGVLVHERVVSSQMSVVHAMPSSQRLPRPSQRPAPSQRSLAVQKRPSSQLVPRGANG